MLELQKTLLNIRSLRAFSKELTLEQLEDALEKLQTVVAERREEEELQRIAQEEQDRKLAEIKQQIDNQGIDIEALISALSGEAKQKQKTSRTPRPPKYKYTDANGDEKTWTGQGRTPSAMQTLIDSGEKRLEDFKINRENFQHNRN